MVELIPDVGNDHEVTYFKRVKHDEDWLYLMALLQIVNFWLLVSKKVQVSNENSLQISTDVGI